MTDVAKGQLVLHGYHVWQEQKNGKMVDVTEPVSYPVEWPALLTGGTKNGQAVVEGSMDFMLTHITHNQADAAGFIPLRVQISDTNGKNLFRDAVYINSVSSQEAGRPFVLVQKRLFRRAATIKVNFSVDA